MSKDKVAALTLGMYKSLAAQYNEMDEVDLVDEQNAKWEQSHDDQSEVNGLEAAHFDQFVKIRDKVEDARRREFTLQMTALGAADRDYGGSGISTAVKNSKGEVIKGGFSTPSDAAKFVIENEPGRWFMLARRDD